ncbi:hypothetical protein CYLTODRAFT_423710 [Cylindrobasidium torrendii FP15055 ss-10]|uniref:DUF6699 domain-containing protein n=1 Tax=Cylindrobasidium torrendii FP15055 ss-10 TaxID=1314674 RepID=A0A0D7B6G0_9AGAR|nr:hypothetical protein CYLTODRAFT_423710 [Cylindrobasidium torrendii FP15055 ss-10]
MTRLQQRIPKDWAKSIPFIPFGNAPSARGSPLRGMPFPLPARVHPEPIRVLPAPHTSHSQENLRHRHEQDRNYQRQRRETLQPSVHQDTHHRHPDARHRHRDTHGHRETPVIPQRQNHSRSNTPAPPLRGILKNKQSVGALSTVSRKSHHHHVNTHEQELPQIAWNFHPYLDGRKPSRRFWLDVSLPRFQPLRLNSKNHWVLLTSRELFVNAVEPGGMLSLSLYIGGETRLKIAVVCDTNPVLTLGNVFHGIYTKLHRRASSSDFEALSANGKERVQQAFRKRCRALGEQQERAELRDGLKRVDLLAGKTHFRGLAPDSAGRLWGIFD